MKICHKKRLANLCLIIVCALGLVYGQNNDRSKKPDEPLLIPLTEEEKKLDPRTIVENQPDFTALEIYFSAREISGFSTATKVARKGNKYRIDTGFVVVIIEPNKPVLKLTGNKTYEEEVGIRKPYVTATVPLNPTSLLGFSDISFTTLGTIEIEGNKLLKIQAKSKDFDQEVYLYADSGKKNLFTIIQILSPQRSSIQRLKDISFEVPDSLFDFSGYRPLPKFKWEKVKTAAVYFKGNLVKDALVFRHENYIFIHVAEFDHFFIDLDKKIADTVVFQGLLVAKTGTYIWRTNEDEAISVGELGSNIEAKCDSCVKIKFDSNTLVIPDPDNTAKVLLRVTW
jgi:hypothetical protein